MIFGVFLAGFLAFKDEHTARVTAENQLRSTPGKDRSNLVGAPQGFYATGSTLQRYLLPSNVTDDQIDQSELAANKWVNDSASWIQACMSAAAASRFVNNTDKPSYSFALDGQHQQREKDKRDNILNSLAGYLTNLETLMKSDQWDSHGC